MDSKRAVRQLEAKIKQAEKKRRDLLEGFISKYLAETGLRIDQVELCERREDNCVTWHLQPKTEESRIVSV
jgi:transposase